MKRFILISMTLSALSGILVGCGGGGGGTAPNTQAVTTVYLFGHMTSTSKVATLHSELTVPEGVMVNYSSPPGATTGKYAVRSGSVVPSGPVKVSQNDITAEFSVSDRKLTIDFVNSPDFNTQIRKNVRSGTVGSGIEVATIYFKLAAPDALPTLPSPWQDLAVIVGEETNSGSLSIIYATGLKLNFVTSFAP